MKIKKSIKINRTNLVVENDINTTADPNVKLLLQKIKAMESGSQEATEDFINCLNLNFGIKNIGSLNQNLSNGSVGVVSTSGKIISGLWSAINRAIKFAAKLIEGFLRWVDPKLMGGSIVGSTVTGLVMGGLPIFTIIAMSIIASCVSMVLFKIYKVVKEDSISESSNSLSINKQHLISISKVIIESNLTFEKLNRVLESTCLTEDSVTTSIDGIITRSYLKCKEMFNWVYKKTSNAFIKTSDFVERNPKFITILLFCIGLVVAYSGCSALKTKLFSSVAKA